MKTIDEARLESDLQYRFEYLCEFMGFGPEDIKNITGAASLLAPVVPALVDAVYIKLFTYDATKRHFMPRGEGFTGDVPLTLEALTLDHPQISFRKQHLTNYLVKLVSGPYDGNMVKYLDNVGKIHTPGKGNKAVAVPLVQMNALMGFVADAVNATILSFKIPDDAKAAAIRSFSKLLWIQNDLISRHYVGK